MDVGALLMPKAHAGHGKPVPKIVRPQRLALIKAGELADLSKSALQASRRESVATRAEEEGLVLGIGKGGIALTGIRGGGIALDLAGC